MTKILKKQYEISGGIFYRVQKLREDTGIISRGFDHLEDCEIEVNNLDAGKSIELFRKAYEGDDSRRGPGIIFILFATITMIIFAIFVFLGYNKYIKTENIPPSTIINTPPVIQVPIVEENDIQEETKTENTTNTIDIERERMRFEFLEESLKIELQKKDLYISKISEENQINIQKIQVLESENEALILENEELLRIIQEKKTSKDTFYIELGKQVEKECKEQKSDNCKNIFYSLISE